MRIPGHIYPLLLVSLLFSCTKEERLPPTEEAPPKPAQKGVKGTKGIHASSAQRAFDRTHSQKGRKLVHRLKTLVRQFRGECHKVCNMAPGRRKAAHNDLIATMKKEGEQFRTALIHFDPLGSRSALYSPLFHLSQEITLLLPVTLNCTTREELENPLKLLEQTLNSMGEYLESL